MDKKIAGLYVSLAKTLNALSEAGEHPAGYILGIDGHEVRYDWDAEALTWRWVVVQG